MLPSIHIYTHTPASHSSRRRDGDNILYRSEERGQEAGLGHPGRLYLTIKTSLLSSDCSTCRSRVMAVSFVTSKGVNRGEDAPLPASAQAAPEPKN